MNTNTKTYTTDVLVVGGGLGGAVMAQKLHMLKPDVKIAIMEKGYFESGFVVKGLLSMPLVNMGAGVFYRYGAYALPKTFDNFAFKYSITFSIP